jgi:hypothetical protein
MSIYKLPNLLRARVPLIYIATYEEERILGAIKDIVKNEKLIKYKREIYTWTEANGLFLVDNGKAVPDTASPVRL